ncbi:hypothetical protein PG985_015036 [Apiospora marii]|uniref:Heterokaryon incompatibility domain-containing protein n=1 Tax=Apiospora marii TaxID=335849 RepID=A0ABR1RJE3_9PEZI
MEDEHPNHADLDYFTAFSSLRTRDYRPIHPSPYQFTIQKPHTCRYCNQLQLHVAEGTFVTSFLKLGSNLDDAIRASLDGCYLYEWILDQAVNIPSYKLKEILSEQNQSLIPFGLEAHRENDGHIDCALFVGLWGMSTRTLRGPNNNTLDVSCSEDDPLAVEISSRPMETDVFSLKSIAFARECLQTCMQYHEKCRAAWLRADKTHLQEKFEHPLGAMIPSEVIDPAELPTRLLEIIRSQDDTIVRLQELRTMSEKEKALAASSGFAILSYCWGKTGNPIRLTADTQGELKKGIPLCTLPKTIRHAIELIIDMSDLHFVWIDALCILQDDDEDKGREIAHMGSYYGSSTVTISAASAADTSEGLTRDPNASTYYGSGPIQVVCTAGDRLHAISAFASHIHDVFRAYGFERDHNIMYVSGLFLATDKVFLSLSQLLWKASRLPLKRINSNLAPSWSWATVNGQVEFAHLHLDGVFTSDQSMFSLMDVDVELKRSNEPYGNVNQALLHFRGFVRSLKSLADMSQSLKSTIESFDADQRDDTIIMLGDTDSDSVTIRDGINGRNITRIFILGLVNEVLEPSSDRPPSPGLGLVLCQQDSVARIPIFRRLGRYKYIQAGTAGIFSDVDYIEGKIG